MTIKIKVPGTIVTMVLEKPVEIKSIDVRIDIADVYQGLDFEEAAGKEE